MPEKKTKVKSEKRKQLIALFLSKFGNIQRWAVARYYSSGATAPVTFWVAVAPLLQKLSSG